MIPPNRPVQRKDLPDFYFKNAEEQFGQAIERAVAVHRTGQPVLIVVTTIGETELISALLMEQKIPHTADAQPLIQGRPFLPDTGEACVECE